MSELTNENTATEAFDRKKPVDSALKIVKELGLDVSREFIEYKIKQGGPALRNWVMVESRGNKRAYDIPIF